ncbi:MAG: desulfoferrodoxin [Deltaproteobacteria bacterium]|nr:MAG: desulfoferrodoxin [Deltaproteobacteria bacterium]
MATETGQEYLCEVCGNKVKVIESGGGELTCCGQAMTLQ